MKRASAVKSIFAAAGLVIAVGLIAPKFHADGYRGRIQAALETALARKVSIGEVRFNLLTGPGFTVSDVVIDEDPALGAEPIAYVKRVQAVPRLWSLFTGHLAFSSLRLEDVNLNLSRADIRNGEYRWNFETLLRPAVIAAFPNISLRGARINFKAGNVKSMVYLLDSNLDVRPPSSSRKPWYFRFEGKPARADRPARGSGAVRASGDWRPGAVDVDVQLESSELGDMIALIRGEDAGLHGLISGRAKLKGSTADIKLEGRMRIEDLHGWDQSIPKGENWPLNLHGRWNLPAQQLELDARVEGAEKPILSVHYLVEQYVVHPSWGVGLELNHFGVETLLPLARHLGVALPEGLQFTGIADGVVSYSVRDGFKGQAAVHQAKFALPGSSPLQIDEAQVMVDAGRVRLLPARVVSADREEAQVDAEYDIAAQRAKVRVASEGMSVAALGKQASLASVPLLSQISAGEWSGELIYKAETGADPTWTGDLTLQRATVPFPGFAAPVLVESAQGRIDEDGFVLQHIHATAAGISIQGDYTYESGENRPHRFHFSAGTVSGSELEAFLMPTLHRQTGLFGIALNLGRRVAVPEWLANWHAEGTLQIAKLDLGAMECDHVSTRVVWDAAHIALPDLSVQLGTGSAKSRVYIDLRKATPAYEAFSQLTGLEWKGGKLDADAVMETRGTGAGLLANLRSNGSFTGHAVLDDVDAVSGRYDFGWKGPLPQLTLNGVRLATSGESYTGKGNLQDDGTLLLQLTSGARQFRMAGTLAKEGALRWMP